MNCQSPIFERIRQRAIWSGLVSHHTEMLDAVRHRDMDAAARSVNQMVAAVEQFARPEATDSQDELARQLEDSICGHFIYCPEHTQWFRWDAGKWISDKKLAAFSTVRDFLREKSRRMHPKAAKQLLTAQSVAAVERLARSSPKLAVGLEIFDQNPWELNTPAESWTCDLVGCVRTTHLHFILK